MERSIPKVALGDHDGVLQVFSIKKGDANHVFKTLPGEEITRLEMGGALGKFIIVIDERYWKKNVIK
jgi:Bardet-Biedl syndrome 7 protein